MPKQYKLKTHKGAQKRYDVTGSGLITRSKALKSHLRRNKSKRARHLFDKKLVLNPSDVKMAKRLIPYGV